MKKHTRFLPVECTGHSVFRQVTRHREKNRHIARCYGQPKSEKLTVELL